MNLFFEILIPKLLIFYTDDQEFGGNLDYVLLCFLLEHQVNHFFVLFYCANPFNFLHKRPLLIPCAYISID